MTGDDAGRMRSRKQDHVDIILKEDVNARANAWDDVTLVHEALPEVDFHAVDLGTRFLDHELDAPLMIASMTGGYPDAERINDHLAQAASAHRIAIGVGSQRAALKSPESRRTFTVLRDHDLPFVAANIGAPQLIPQGDAPPLTRDQIDELVSMLEADALIVHLNFLQEAVQPEGDLQAAGCEAAIRDLSQDLGVPVIAKETGAGVTRRTATRLREAGVHALDVGGLSGTTFAAVEQHRAAAEGARDQERLGTLFRDWGIPTPVSVSEAQVDLPVIATGGIRHGVDVARGIALGATLAGMASAVLHAADRSAADATRFLESVKLELRTACFLTGAPTPADLRERPLVVRGMVADWLARLGHDVSGLGRRGRSL